MEEAEPCQAHGCLLCRESDCARDQEEQAIRQGFVLMGLSFKFYKINQV